ncbi:hypothetical protein PMZ80_001411 [Knufia obscura]|uniref:DUF647-domain-containing protein n=1 Tax=Knufia obscura TaxID=1635080 RepID=A0ABR0S316_9EURO|nr:hypothetical protein PMZ80_001411 [Knufia obscura]
MAPKKQLTLREIDPTSGQTTKTYILSTIDAGLGSNKQNARLDQIPLQPSTTAATEIHLHTNAQRHQFNFNALLLTYYHTLLTHLKSLFLPTGYPHTVTPDYTPYQLYDSIQAFASTIAGLLSSRAVLQSLNVISSSSSPSSSSDTPNSTNTIPPDSATAATAATLLSILQSTLSNLTTILFASHAAPRISTDVKFYRFLADVANDAAFVLDLLAPSLPGTFGVLLSYLPMFDFVSRGETSLLRLYRLELLAPFIASPRVVVLCTSAMLRAICGVAGGSSKAVLSAHFARDNPESVGDLNAKDGSQETVVNLVGMWIGGFVVSRVDGFGATWCWMGVLLAVHMWANYRAVRSVRLRGLNRERAGVVMGRIVAGEGAGGEGIGVDVVGRDESVLGMRRWIARLWRRESTATWRSWKVGVSVEEFLEAIGGSGGQLGRSKTAMRQLAADQLSSLISIFEGEAYLLWISERGKVAIALKKDATPVTQLRAFYHAFLAQQSQARYSRNKRQQVLELLSDSLEEVRQSWEKVRSKLEETGWDLNSTNLEDGQGVRIDMS